MESNFLDKLGGLQNQEADIKARISRSTTIKERSRLNKQLQKIHKSINNILHSKSYKQTSEGELKRKANQSARSMQKYNRAIERQKKHEANIQKRIKSLEQLQDKIIDLEAKIKTRKRIKRLSKQLERAKYQMYKRQKSFEKIAKNFDEDLLHQKVAPAPKDYVSKQYRQNHLYKAISAHFEATDFGEYLMSKDIDPNEFLNYLNSRFPDTREVFYGDDEDEDDTFFELEFNDDRFTTRLNEIIDEYLED